MEGVNETVEKGWQIAVIRSEMFQIHQKVINTRMQLIAWAKPSQRNNGKKIQLLTQKLEEMREEGKDRDWESWGQVKLDLDRVHKEEEQFWRLKSRALCLKECYCNSRFFHAYTSQRRKANSIQRLVTDSGSICESKPDLEQHISEFYNTLFTSESSGTGPELLQHIS
ncbi:tonoplast monosaccharide transporter2 [Striga asiatica]|uniref:Tonoplast monosaccharide transporter2 n=1 Tax=Striga asiatica TaxID=4170 RepID=A0A5A7RKT6_STRAF|nr:tonoplast monosaccharide transporter2 [Striga asiatica]